MSGSKKRTPSLNRGKQTGGLKKESQKEEPRPTGGAQKADARATGAQKAEARPTGGAQQPPEVFEDLREYHRRTLRFMLSIVVETLFPEDTLSGGHAVGKGYWYTLGRPMTQGDVESVNQGLKDLIKENVSIFRQERPWKEVLTYLETHRQPLAAALIRSRVTPLVQVHECKGHLRLYGTSLYPTTGLRGYFACTLHGGDLLLAHTQDFELQPALVESLNCHKSWGLKSSGVRCFGDLNLLEVMPHNLRRKLILDCEFRQEHKLVQIATQIHERKGAIRVLCIAGPTSSGKTTFANKLSIYLSNLGYEAKALTVDHYYLSLPDQPRYKIRNQRGDVNYDHIESMDVELVNAHVSALMRGDTIPVPRYNMKTGIREPEGTPFSLPPNGIVVMEGIHALNPAYTAGVAPENVFKVYISPLSALQVDDFNAVKTTNHRLLRRMCRDYLFRGHSVSKTLAMWDRVREGEDSFIFPFQNKADFVMNSAMEYELCVLKTFLEPGLAKVTPDDPNFRVAQELLMTLKYIACWDDHFVPSPSLLREFIGNGAFDEH